MTSAKNGLSRRASLAWLFALLVLVASTERRLAECDFDSSTHVRWENNEKPDGDEVRVRLMFVDDVALPFVLVSSEVRVDDAVVRTEGRRQVFFGSRSDSRAPPRSHPVPSA
jgi:hypothetical protein